MNNNKNDNLFVDASLIFNILPFCPKCLKLTIKMGLSIATKLRLKNMNPTTRLELMRLH